MGGTGSQSEPDISRGVADGQNTKTFATFARAVALLLRRTNRRDVLATRRRTACQQEAALCVCFFSSPVSPKVRFEKHVVCCLPQQFCGVLGHTFMEFLKGSGDYCQAQHATYADE